MQSNALVSKVRASGYHPAQVKKPMPKPVNMSKKHSLTTVDTKKGQSRAYVARDAMPISIEPIKAPESKTLAQIGRSIRNA